MSSQDAQSANESRQPKIPVELPEGLPENNCNQSVEITNWDAAYQSANKHLSMFAEVTPVDMLTSLSFVRVVMYSVDKQTLGAAFTFFEQNGEPPSLPSRMMVALNAVTAYVAPGPGTSVVGTVDGVLETPLGKCQFYFEQVFTIN